jgi:hypothetical protein
LISQDIYHKSAILEPDWYYLSNIKIDKGFYKSKDSSYFSFNEGTRQIVGNNGYFALYNNGILINSYGAYDYSSVMALSKTYKFSIHKPDNFNYFKRYVSSDFLSLQKLKYQYKIQVSNTGDTFMSFSSKGDFFISVGSNEYFDIDNELFSFEVSESSFLEIASSYTALSSALYNSMVQDGSIQGNFLTEYDYYHNEISRYSDITVYGIGYEYEETQEDMINEIINF